MLTVEAYGRLLADATLASVMHVSLGIGGEGSRRPLEAVEDVLGTVR